MNPEDKKEGIEELPETDAASAPEPAPEPVTAQPAASPDMPADPIQDEVSLDKTKGGVTQGGEPPHEKHIGALIGIVLIIVILLVGGVYIWGKIISERTNNAPAQETTMPQTETPPTAQELRTQGTSDAVSAIEADLNATDLNALDAELEQIESELGI